MNGKIAEVRTNRMEIFQTVINNKLPIRINASSYALNRHVLLVSIDVKTKLALTLIACLLANNIMVSCYMSYVIGDVEHCEKCVA